MATTFVLFVTCPPMANLPRSRGARARIRPFENSRTGVLLPDGRSQIFAMDRVRNIAAFEALAAGDGARFGADMDRLGADAPFLFGCSAARCGPGHGQNRRARSLEAPPAAALPRSSGRRSSSARCSNSATVRRCSMRSGRPGCCIQALVPKAPIP